MLQSLVVLVDLIGLFILKTFILANITITQNVPATMRPGEEVKVTVNIEKGNLGGFAKLQFDLPPGLSIQSIDAKGASFTFADGKAKFIWMALPSQPSFKITYNLIADANAFGNLSIDGRLSYIENNERRTYDMPASSVRIEGGAAPVAKAAEPTPLAEPGPELVTAAGGAPISLEPEPSTTEQQGRVTVNRSITAMSDSEFLVEVSISKGDIRGFGKLQETIPQGFTALEKNSEDAIFTAQDRVIKFVWLNLPARNEMLVVYKLRSNGQPEGQYSVSGEFGYLVNDETLRAPLPATSFNVGGTVATKEEPKTTEPTVPVTPPVKETPKETPRDVAVQTPTPQPKPKETPRTDPSAQRTTPRVPAPETGITYRVQICAGHREVSRNYFVQRHRFHGEFNTERHEGWIKYTTGRFGNYREARDQRVAFVNAGHQFPGPFVTAYNDGVRITVQEALMISNQKWVQ